MAAGAEGQRRLKQRLGARELAEAVQAELRATRLRACLCKGGEASGERAGRIVVRVIQHEGVEDANVYVGAARGVAVGLVDALQHIQTFRHLSPRQVDLSEQSAVGSSGRTGGSKT